MQLVNHKKCLSCKYYGVSICGCDYAEMTGELRTLKDGKKRKETENGNCDKYEKTDKETYGRRWAVEKRSNWQRIHGNT